MEEWRERGSGDIHPQSRRRLLGSCVDSGSSLRMSSAHVHARIYAGRRRGENGFALLAAYHENGKTSRVANKISLTRRNSSLLYTDLFQAGVFVAGQCRLKSQDVCRTHKLESCGKSAERSACKAPRERHATAGFDRVKSNKVWIFL